MELKYGVEETIDRHKDLMGLGVNKYQELQSRLGIEPRPCEEKVQDTGGWLFGVGVQPGAKGIVDRIKCSYADARSFAQRITKSSVTGRLPPVLVRNRLDHQGVLLPISMHCEPARASRSTRND
jgi:hypothetical protein